MLSGRTVEQSPANDGVALGDVADEPPELADPDDDPDDCDDPDEPPTELLCVLSGFAPEEHPVVRIAAARTAPASSPIRGNTLPYMAATVASEQAGAREVNLPGTVSLALRALVVRVV